MLPEGPQGVLVVREDESEGEEEVPGRAEESVVRVVEGLGEVVR